MVKLQSKLGLKLVIGSQFCPLTSEAFLHKILAISSQMHFNGEVSMEIGVLRTSLAGGRHEKLHICRSLIKIIAMCQFLGWLMVPHDWFFKQFCFQFKWENGPFISQQAAIIHWNLQMQLAAFLHWVEYVYEGVINMMNGGHSLCMQISRL